MSKRKLLLFMSVFMVMTLTNVSHAGTVQFPDSIDQAIAMINNAIDEAIALVRGAVDNPEEAGEAIDDACSLIKEAIDKANALIREAVAEDVNSIEEKIDESISSMQEENEENITSMQEEIREDIQETIEDMAQKLAEKGTIKPNEIDFAGSIVTGMVSAYELIGDNTYRIKAELAGKNILSIASGNFKGEEIFAIVRLSQIYDSTDNNIWWTTLCDFYQNIQNNINGTEDYISQLASSGLSTTVFNLAYYTITADYVGAVDREIWRRELINYLVQVDDNCSDSPVMLLGMATWALSLTGELDNTLLDPSGTGALCWRNKKLKDLPAILASHQVPAGELNAGNFYHRFDHNFDVISDLLDSDIEDTIFATLGLISAYNRDPNSEIEATIIAAQQAIIEMINPNGDPCPQLDDQCLEKYRLLAAEILQVFRELFIALDMNP
jgi:F0F1-type ATP synthase membrane subunit b/b'